MKKKTKMSIIIALIIGVLLVASGIIVFSLNFAPKNASYSYGVTFSYKQAVRLSEDWKQMYDDILKDLPLDHIRLVAYWDDIELYPDEYYFQDLKYQVEHAKEKGVPVILSVGRRVPRFPECFVPEWMHEYSPDQQNEYLLKYLEALVEEFKGYDNIAYWQVENEYFLTTFGFCSNPDPEFFKKEIQLVKNLDSRPIVVTHSGELGNWKDVATYGDIFGTTMYRTVWNKYLGDFTWFLPASFYASKTQGVKGTGVHDVWVIELQAEPWGRDFGFITDLSIDDQFDQFGLDKFKKNVAFAKKAGFTHITLWGVEWWWWLKEQGHPEFWEYYKSLP